MSLRATTRSRAAAATLAVVAGAMIATGLAPATVGVASGATAPRQAPSLDVEGDPDARFGVDEVTQILVQPDGFEFKARMTDLKVGGLFETLAGYGVERGADRVWRYITSVDDAGRPTLGAVVSAARPPRGLAKHLGRHAVDLSDPELATRELIGKQLRSVAAKLEEGGTSERAAGPRVFYVPALMLATWYDDATESGPTFHAPTDTPEYFKKLLDGFGGNPYGSMTQFYYEASFGQFLVRVDVYGTYTSARSIGDPCYYGSPEAGEVSVTDPVGRTLGLGGLGALGMATEAVPQASGIPWGKYDNDSDGVVDFTMIIHSGGGHEVTGDACHTHSHAITASSLANIATGLLGIDAETLHVGIPTSSPGVFVNRVVTIPEFESSDSPLTIGVATHEMAHAIGEPDYYDTTYNSVGTGDFDIMAGGSYLGNPSGSNPSMQNPATRVFQRYVTPTIVRGSLKGYKLRPRTSLPRKGYKFGKPDPNLLLVPTYERRIGQVDPLGHEWTAEDVYGLAYNPRTKAWVVEGFYIENVARNATSVKLNKKNPMGSMFDRQMHSSGLAVWHFDYWRQSSTYFGGSNDAQSDLNRYQMDLEEFDQNDNTQELQLNYARGNASDLLTAAATGITSGTHLLPPGSGASKGGSPQKPVEFSGTSTPITPGEFEFTVDRNKANEAMTVSVGSDLSGDCKLQLTDPSGKTGDEVDGGGPGDEESIAVKKPQAGTWTATVGDFAACGSYSGRVLFEGGATGSFSTLGSADTWSNWTKKPTGWAFTNVRGYGNGLDFDQEGGPGNGTMVLDVLNLSRAKDVSPGFVVGRPSRTGGNAPISAGTLNKMSVPVFSNGGRKAGRVEVVVREGSATGRVVARRTVKIGAYGRKAVGFRFRPNAEGPVRLVTIVDPARRIKEGNEGNQVQVTHLWAGPAAPKVLVVDDDQTLTHENAIRGALAVNGISYATYGAHPSFEVLKKYRAVIWSSGVDRYEGQLNNADRAAIKKYLDRGGKVILIGNRVLDSITTQGSSQTPASAVSLGAQYFGVRTPTGNPSYIVSQSRNATTKGLGVLQGLKRITFHPAPARQFVGIAGLSDKGTGALGSTIRPHGKASGIVAVPASLLGAVTPAGDAPYLGVMVDGDRAHRGFKTAVLGRNLGENDNAAVTAKLVGTLMRHFGVRTGSPLRPRQTLVHHTPVRDSVSGRKVTLTAVVLGPRGTTTPTVSYRRHGRGRFYSARMRPGSVPGTWVFTLPAKAVTPDGVDYTIRAGAGISPYGAQGPLFHSVAVAMPVVKKPMKVRR